MTREAPLPRLGYLTLAGVTLGWGLNFVAMKVAMTEIPPFTFRAASCGIAGLCLLAIARTTGGRVLPRGAGEPAALAWCALLNVVLWQMLVGYAVLIMPSGHAGLIGFTMPLWAAVFGALFFGEALTRRHIAALALGLAGVGVLMAEGLAGIGEAPTGAVLMLLAAAAWGLGTLVQKRVRWSISVFAFAGWQLFLASLPLALLAPAIDGLSLPPVSARGWGAAAYVTLVALVFCYVTWAKTVSLFPAIVASIGTLAIPIINVLAGAALLDEPLGGREGLAILLIAAGLALVLIAPAARSARRAAD